jgi:hypothetical protein
MLAVLVRQAALANVPQVLAEMGCEADPRTAKSEGKATSHLMMAGATLES